MGKVISPLSLDDRCLLLAASAEAFQNAIEDGDPVEVQVKLAVNLRHVLEQEKVWRGLPSGIV